MRPLLALLLLQAFSVTLVTRRNNSLKSSLPSPTWRCAAARVAAIRGLRGGRDEVVTVLYSRTEWYKVRAPRGPGRLVAPLRFGSHQARLGRAGADTAYPDFATHRWEIGAVTASSITRIWSTTWGDFGLTDSLDVEFVLQQGPGYHR